MRAAPYGSKFRAGTAEEIESTIHLRAESTVPKDARQPESARSPRL